MSDQNGNSYLDLTGHYKLKSCLEFGLEIEKLIYVWQSFLDAQGEGRLVQDRDYFIHKRNIYEVVKRLDKRRTYYFVFHDIKRICEYKEVGILAYWINTLKPFMVVNPKSKIYNSPNEMFSFYLILSTLAEVYQYMYPDKIFSAPDDKTIQDHVYNFKYCDLSRESMIFYVETFAKSYGIGMETNATRDMRV